MKKCQLKDIDPDDIDDLLVKIESSFGIQFVKGELAYISNFGQLCDHIVSKMNLENKSDCTSQQAFYRLRESIYTTSELNNISVLTNLDLAEIYPRKSRRKQIKNIEDHLGYKINILRPPEWVSWLLTIALLTSIVTLFFNWKMGLLSICVSFGGFWLADKLGIEFKVKTVGEVAEKMTREHYLNSRRNRRTFNQREIQDTLTNWFSSELGIGISDLTREAKFE